MGFFNWVREFLDGAPAVPEPDYTASASNNGQGANQVSEPVVEMPNPYKSKSLLDEFKALRYIPGQLKDAIVDDFSLLTNDKGKQNLQSLTQLPAESWKAVKGAYDYFRDRTPEQYLNDLGPYGYELVRSLNPVEMKPTDEVYGAPKTEEEARMRRIAEAAGGIASLTTSPLKPKWVDYAAEVWDSGKHVGKMMNGDESLVEGSSEILKNILNPAIKDVGEEFVNYLGNKGIDLGSIGEAIGGSSSSALLDKVWPKKESFNELGKLKDVPDEMLNVIRSLDSEVKKQVRFFVGTPKEEYEVPKELVHEAGNVDYVPKGKDTSEVKFDKVYYLNNSNGAGLQGHAAVILGTRDGKGLLYSFEGDRNRSVRILRGQDVPGKLVTSTDRSGFEQELFDMDDFIDKGVILHRDYDGYVKTDPYDRLIEIPITDEQGKAIYSAAEELRNEKDLKYNLYANNCNHMAQQLLENAGLDFTSTKGDPYLEQATLVQALSPTAPVVVPLTYAHDRQDKTIPNAAYEYGAKHPKGENWKPGTAGPKQHWNPFS